MMCMKFYISDLHFGHESVIRFDNRPFLNAEEMDEKLIQWWNAAVSEHDEVYIVGDFAYRNKQPEEWYLNRLHGSKHLVIGNHDHKLLKNEKAMGYFSSVDKMMHVSDEGKQICLCHFPMIEWNKMRWGSWHIHGHVHNRASEPVRYMKTLEKALNAAACINNYVPVSMEQLIINNSIWKKE